MATMWSESPLPSDYTQLSTDADVLAKNGYMLGAEIGSGSYSTVMMVAKDNVAYACKIVNLAKTTREYRTRFLPREINIISRLHHPNITRVFQMICEAKKVFIVMELATAGDLLSRIQSTGRLDERTAHHIFVQLASAVAYLHQRNIAHRDLKCDNVLLTTKLIVKLADFSFTRYCNDPFEGRKMVLSETYCGSGAYAPPEVLQGVPYLPKQSDMWSLGVILYVMMTGALPFPDGNIVMQLFQEQRVQIISQLDGMEGDLAGDGRCDSPGYSAKYCTHNVVIIQTDHILQREQVRLQMNRAIRFPEYINCTHQYRSLVRLLMEPVTTLRATIMVVMRHPWLFLFPDHTNTLTREVQPCEAIGQHSRPVVISGRQQEQPSQIRATPEQDQHDVPLPTLDRKAAAESLRGQCSAGRTCSRTFSDELHLLSDAFQSSTFQEEGVHHIATDELESEDSVFDETTVTTTLSNDDEEDPEDEKTSLPIKQSPMQSEIEPHRSMDRYSSDETHAFSDSQKMSFVNESTSQQTQLRVSSKESRSIEDYTYPGQPGDAVEDQFVGHQQPLSPCYHNAADGATGLCRSTLCAYEGQRCITMGSYTDHGFANARSPPVITESILPSISGVCGTYGPWEPHAAPSISRRQYYSN